MYYMVYENKDCIKIAIYLRRLEILKFNYLDCRNTIINCSQRKILYVTHVLNIFKFYFIMELV